MRAEHEIEALTEELISACSLTWDEARRVATQMAGELAAFAAGWDASAARHCAALAAGDSAATPGE